MSNRSRRRGPRCIGPGVVAALLCAFALAGTGCAVNQADEVAAYRKVIDLRPTALNPAIPLTLGQALLLANQNNENLALEGEDYLQALIERHRAVSSLLPTVDLSATHSRAERLEGSGGDATDVAADLNWNVFNGFRDLNRYWRETYRAEQQRNDLLAFQETLLLDVAQVYYEVLRSEASVRVLENSLSVQEERLRDARGRVEAGVARPLDVAQTEAQASATRTALIDARRDVVTARNLLALLTDAPVTDVPLEDAYAPPTEIDPLERYLAAATEARRDVAAAAAAVAAARRDVEVAWGQYYPSVSLNLSAFLYRESVPDERDWNGLLSANLPLFSAGRIRADVREAWSFFRQALLVRSFLVRQATEQVATAYHELAASVARLAELQVQVTAAEQAFRQAEASYRAGLATNLERVAAQDALLSAQLQLAREEFDREVFHLALLRAAGLLRAEVESMVAAHGGEVPGDATPRPADPPPLP